MTTQTTASESSINAPLSLVEKVGYGVGDMASNFYMGVINVYLLYYYTAVWGISPASAGFMFLITKVVDAISDPAMGLIADRTQTRWGRYRPYLLWGAVPCSRELLAPPSDQALSAAAFNSRLTDAALACCALSEASSARANRR